MDKITPDEKGLYMKKTRTSIHGLFHMKNQSCFSALPEELCPRRAELQDSANQTLTLIKRWRGTGEVEFTVRLTKHPCAAVRKERAHTMFRLVAE